MPDHSPEALTRAVLYTLAYADIFDYPLTAPEIHHYLTGLHAPLEAILRTLGANGLSARRGDYFTLPGREEIVSVRMQREARSRALLPRAMQYGRLLGALPFVRMAALTGSLAMLNLSSRADMDYMLVTQTGRLWTARAFAVTLGRLLRPLGHRICVNLLVSENALFWPRHDLYSAREMCQMIPITGADVYCRLRAANAWTESILPNSTLSAPVLARVSPHNETNRIQRLLELPLRGQRGARLEQWAMEFQLHLMSQRPGAGEETSFSPDVCQANFDHHGSWTRRAFEKRLQQYIVAGDPWLRGGAPASRGTFGVATQSPHLP
ncbi:MAG TPA: hypothetical protein VI524_05440 [Anaerolineales bacterium]|nr:hypothetical protein [Anaerolineales bacterium]